MSSSKSLRMICVCEHFSGLTVCSPKSRWCQRHTNVAANVNLWIIMNLCTTESWKLEQGDHGEWPDSFEQSFENSWKLMVTVWVVPSQDGKKLKRFDLGSQGITWKNQTRESSKPRSETCARTCTSSPASHQLAFRSPKKNGLWSHG